MNNSLNKNLDMIIEELCRDNVCKKIGDYQKKIYLGIDLRSRIRKKTECVLLFLSVYEKQEFVKSTLEAPVNVFSVLR